MEGAFGIVDKGGWVGETCGWGDPDGEEEGGEWVEHCWLSDLWFEVFF